MLHKIQPQQIELHTFTSLSGNNINVIQTDTGVDINLSSTPSGSFDFNGSLLINGARPLLPNSSNSFDTGGNNLVLGGSENTATGIENIIVGATGSTLSGRQNLDLHGFNTVFGADCAENTVIAGQSVTFGDSVTGATVIADTSAGSVSDRGNYTLTVEFESGIYMNSLMYALGGINVDASNSGLFSGKLKVIGDQTNDANLNVGGSLNVTGVSSVTGSSIATESWVNQRDTGAYVYPSGTGIDDIQTISGSKRFAHNIEMYPDSPITDTGRRNNIILFDEADEFAAIGDVGSSLVIAADNSQVIALNTGALINPDSGILTDNQNASSDAMLKVITGKNVEATGARFAVDQKGNIMAQGTLIMKGGGTNNGMNTEFFPSSSASSDGVDGQVAYSGDFLAIRRAGVWVRFSGESSW